MSIITNISRSLRVLFVLFSGAMLGVESPGIASAEVPQQTGAKFTIITINMNGVPDILRLPDVDNAKTGQVIDVSIGEKRWEENFYLIVEGPADLPWRIEQRQVNCLVDPADSTLLKSWPNRLSDWREMSFVGTNRYKGNLFLEQDIQRLTKEELELYARKSAATDLEKNLQIAARLVNKPEGNSYNCRNEIRVSLSKAVAGQAPLEVTFNIAVDNF